MEKNSRVVYFDYHAELESLCFVISSGSIVEFSLKKEEGEIVGEVPQGLLAASWSPDLDLLALLTASSSPSSSSSSSSNSSTVLLLTKDWQVRWTDFKQLTFSPFQSIISLSPLLVLYSLSLSYSHFLM